MKVGDLVNIFAASHYSPGIIIAMMILDDHDGCHVLLSDGSLSFVPKHNLEVISEAR